MSALRPSPPRSIKRPALPGFASYLSDWKTVLLIETMLKVDPKKMRKASKERSHFSYDKLQVVGVWHISNPSRMEHYEQVKLQEKKGSCGPVALPFEMPHEYQDAMNALGKDQLDESAGEVFLLHGTDPTRLYSILFEGLDPTVAANGNFGRGVYFAEHAAKVDQYGRIDKRHEKEGPLSSLHEKIYAATNHRHPTNVRYCLISRVVLGRHIVTTKDGKTRLCDKGKLFTETRSALSPLANANDDGTTITPSALVAEPGGRVKTFREYVVFQPERIFVEYHL